MNLDRINQWLTLLGNFGVILGIFFVAYQIDQSNRLADQDAYNELTSVFNAFNLALATDPELGEIARVAATGELVEEDSSEFQQLRGFAELLVNNWTLVDDTFLLGQLSEEDYPFWVYDVTSSIERWPGLAPHIEYLLRNNSNVSGIEIEDTLKSGYFSQDIRAGEAYLAMIRAVLGTK